MRGPRPRKTKLSRNLRSAQTDAEALLWRHLRNRQLGGQKFVRQDPIGPYICDLVCREKRLIVEADGGQHADSAADATRDQWLTAHGYRVLRFWNNDILENIDGVLETIAAALDEA
jgi:very-short-patch-repair endonuclease